MATEMFPRFLLPAAAAVTTVNYTALAFFRKNIAATLQATPSVLAQADMRLDDYTWFTYVTQMSTATAAGVSFVSPQGAHYSIFPVLVDCQGRQVTSAFFAAAGPDIDRCVAARIPISSYPGTNGSSTFAAFVPLLVASNRLAPISSIQSTLSLDRRLLLWGEDEERTHF